MQNIELIAGKTILIVDDHPTARKIMKIVLRKSKLNILEADNFEQSVEILESQTVDLIFMDLQMPDIYGVDAAKIIRSGKCFKNFKNFEKIPIIAFSSSSDKELLTAAFAAGMNDHFNKASDIHELIRILVKWLT